MRKIQMGGGVPGTPEFPYWGSECSWDSQSDWGLQVILLWKEGPKGYLFSEKEKAQAAAEWRRRYPSGVQDCKSWARRTATAVAKMAADASLPF